jgi:hypothetical protein
MRLGRPRIVSLPSVHMDKQRGCTNTARDVVRCCEELGTRVRRCRDRGARALWDVTEDL